MEARDSLRALGLSWPTTLNILLISQNLEWVAHENHKLLETVDPAVLSWNESD